MASKCPGKQDNFKELHVKFVVFFFFFFFFSNTFSKNNLDGGNSALEIGF